MILYLLSEANSPGTGIGIVNSTLLIFVLIASISIYSSTALPLLSVIVSFTLVSPKLIVGVPAITPVILSIESHVTFSFSDKEYTNGSFPPFTI